MRLVNPFANRRPVMAATAERDGAGVIVRAGEESQMLDGGQLEECGAGCGRPLVHLAERLAGICAFCSTQVAAASTPAAAGCDPRERG